MFSEKDLRESVALMDETLCRYVQMLAKDLKRASQGNRTQLRGIHKPNVDDKYFASFMHDNSKSGGFILENQANALMFCEQCGESSRSNRCKCGYYLNRPGR